MTERERIVALCPLPDGWRAVWELHIDRDVDPTTLKDEDLYVLSPIACLSLIETWSQTTWNGSPENRWDERLDRSVRAVTIDGGAFDGYGDLAQPIAILGPGEHPGDWIRHTAIRRIIAERERVDRAIAKRDQQEITT